MSTTAKRKKPREEDQLRRPFDKKVMARAKAIAARYQIKIWREDGHWFGVGVEEPGTYGDGRTLQQCVKDVREALAVTVAYMIESGQSVVRPLLDQERGRRRKAG
jgi:predicted RNase H-like HicB family nuclease